MTVLIGDFIMSNDDNQVEKEKFHKQVKKMTKLFAFAGWSCVAVGVLSLILRIVYEFTDFNSIVYFVFSAIALGAIVLLLVIMTISFFRLKHLKKTIERQLEQENSNSLDGVDDITE